MTYIDTYISGPIQNDLELFAQNFTNHITPQAGSAAVAEDDTVTPPIPAQPAKGDPALFYTLIRATFDITPLVVHPFNVVDKTTGASVVGVFA